MRHHHAHLPLQVTTDDAPAPDVQLTTSMTVMQLRDYCRHRGLQGFSGKNKAQLIEFMRGKDVVITGPDPGVAERVPQDTPPVSAATIKEMEALCRQHGLTGFYARQYLKQPGQSRREGLRRFMQERGFRFEDEAVGPAAAPALPAPGSVTPASAVPVPEDDQDVGDAGAVAEEVSDEYIRTHADTALVRKLGQPGLRRACQARGLAWSEKMTREQLVQLLRTSGLEYVERPAV